MFKCPCSCRAHHKTTLAGRLVRSLQERIPFGNAETTLFALTATLKLENFKVNLLWEARNRNSASEQGSIVQGQRFSALIFVKTNRMIGVFGLAQSFLAQILFVVQNVACSGRIALRHENFDSARKGFTHAVSPSVAASI